MINENDQRAQPPRPTTAGGRARSHEERYMIHTLTDRSRRVILSLHAIYDLAESDRDLLIRLQSYIDQIDQYNNYNAQLPLEVLDM